MSTKSKPQADKPAGGRPFVVPDRKAQPQAQNNKPKPAYNNSNGNNGYKGNKPKFVQPKVEKAAWSRPFIVPDRKQQVQAAKVISDATAKANGKGKFAVSQGKRTWWENHDSVDSLDLIKFEEGQAWHTLLPAYLNETDGNNVKLSGDKLVLATKLIDVAYQKQMKMYNETLKNSTEMKGDLKWMNDMIKSGTMSDKVAAMALKVQSSPFHELETLDTLIGMALKKEQRSAQLAIEALKDLFVNNLLPERQLRTLEHNSFSHASMTLNTALLVWFESQLKSRYEKVLEALDNGLKSNVDFFKRECLQTISELLIGKPEQEARLLSMLVNKLGDPSRATCSKAIEALKQVVRSHPAMKIVVVREVRQFLYRPNLKIRPIFNGIILLSNVQLNKGDHAVAVQLVEGYLSLFEKTMKEEEYGSRLLSALLTGINKALPFLDNTESLGKYVDPLFRIVHTASSFSTATQALMLLSHLALSIGNEQQARKGKHAAADGEKAEKKGEETEEAQIIKRYYRALYAKLLSDQITTRSRNTLFLNLLYRSIKGDPLHHRAVAFLKRLLICAAQSVPPIAAGLLFLVSEIVRARPTLKECLANVPEQIATTASGEVKEVGEDGGFLGNFNVLKREPEFAYAPDAQPSVWEISLLRRHFHPSVAQFATSLLHGPEHHIEFGGDPTVEFSLMAFLNRFAYKNPKKNTADRIKHRTAASEEPVNLTLTHKDSAEVDPDQQFFHKYFSDKQQLVAEGRSRNRSKRAAEESDNEGSDNEGNDSDPDEAAIDRYATKLAEDMMRSADGNRDEEDLDFSDEDDSDDGSAVMGPEDGAEGEGDSDSEDGQDFDQGLVGESDSDSEEEEEVEKESRKKVAKKIAKITGVTSDALDFADFLAEQEKKNKTSKKASKNSKKAKSGDDSSDDGYGLQAYGDEEEQVEEGYDGFDDDSLVASDVEIPDSDGEDEDDDEGDDFEEADLDDDSQASEGSEEEYDSQESDGGMEFDESDDEALEDAALFDSDNERSSNKAKSAKKGKQFEKKAPTSKKSRGSDSDFASAEDYEDMMEEILQSVNNKKPKAEPVPVVPAKDAKNTKQDAKKGAEKNGKKDFKENKKAAPAPVVDNKKRKETPAVVAKPAGKANNSKKQKKI